MKRLFSLMLPFSLGLAVVMTGYMAINGQLPGISQARAEALHTPLPEFTQTSPQAWLNSAPLKRADLAGKVVLIDVWTYACWNCYRSFPWLHEVEDKYHSKGLQVIGIHSPEFPHEHKRENVENAIEKYQLKHPVMMDNDFAFWKKLNNRYWPAYYLIDKRGNIRYRFIGETHSGDARAQKVEAAIEYLLNEKI